MKRRVSIGLDHAERIADVLRKEPLSEAKRLELLQIVCLAITRAKRIRARDAFDHHDATEKEGNHD